MISRFEASKCAVPLSSGAASRAVEQAQHAADRVVGEVRIGDMALLALHGHVAGERAAPADLDHVAEGVRVGRLAEDAMVEAFAARLRPGEQLDGAVDRRTFLVAGDQEADRAGRNPACPREMTSAAAIMQAMPPFMSTAPRP